MMKLIEREVGLRAGIELDTALGANNGVVVPSVQGGLECWGSLTSVADAERSNRRLMFPRRASVLKRFLRVLGGVWIVAALVVAVFAVPASAEFGLEEFDVTFNGAEGGAELRAGSHPYEMTTSLEAITEPGPGGPVPTELLKDINVFQDPGFVGDPIWVFHPAPFGVH